jgi:hypothetical protein
MGINIFTQLYHNYNCGLLSYITLHKEFCRLLPMFWSSLFKVDFYPEDRSCRLWYCPVSYTGYNLPYH